VVILPKFIHDISSENLLDFSPAAKWHRLAKEIRWVTAEP
jgi:hypothetical protein